MLVGFCTIMSQNVEISRANWIGPIQRKHFIDLCLQEANKDFRSWRFKLEKLLGKRYTSKQLKNGWDYMKRQYLIWSKMMTMTGHAEKWEEYLQKYPKAKQFRFKPLANVEELEALFGGVLATGETSISLEEDEDLPRNTNDEAKVLRKKKKRKKEQTQEEMKRIMNVLENFEGPSVKECMKILKKLLTYEDLLYYYREVWVEMESDKERMGWIQSLRK
ncbi:hypothetical protein AAG906_008255 [Vitis piasezkii]